MDPTTATLVVPGVDPTPLELPLRNDSFDQSLVRKTPVPNVPGAFTLSNTLTEKECEDIIRVAFSDQSMAGATPVFHRAWDKDKAKAERKLGKRIIRKGEQPAAILYERLRDWFPQELKFISEDKEDKGTEYTWKIDRLSTRFRMVQYDPHGRFPPHFDEAEIHNRDCRSFLSLVFYLDKCGGLLSRSKDFRAFLHRDAVQRKASVIHKVIPEPGLACIFPHKTLHESRPIVSGHKYTLRLDIIYKRVGGKEA